MERPIRISSIPCMYLNYSSIPLYAQVGNKKNDSTEMETF